MDNQTQTTVPSYQMPMGPPPPPNNLRRVIFLVLLLMVVIGASIFVGIQIGKKGSPGQENTPPAQIVQSPTPTIKITPDINPTEGWKTYTDPKGVYAFRYPKNYTLGHYAGEESPVLINKRIDFILTQYPLSSCRGDCPVVTRTQGTTLNAYQATLYEGWVGSIGGEIPQAYVKYEVKRPGTESYFAMTLWELDRTSDAQKDYSQERKIGPIGEDDKKVFGQILSTLKFSDSPGENWRTYENSVLKYSISYPPDWLLDTSAAELPRNDENSQRLIVYKDQYKMTILWPAAYGPGICLFDDESRTGAPEMADYCEGQYVEFKSNGGKAVHRRLVNSTSMEGLKQWEVYTKQDNYFATVPVIRYESPVEYAESQINVMDQILSSYKSKAE